MASVGGYDFTMDTPPPIDPIADTAKAYTMAQGISDYSQGQKERTEANSDQATVMAAMKDPKYNFNTPDGLDSALSDLQGKVTPATYMALQKNVDAAKQKHIDYQTKLMSLDDYNLEGVQKSQEYVYNSESSVLDAYKKAVEAKKVDPSAPDPMQVYNTAKVAKIQELAGIMKPGTNVPMFDPKTLQSASQMTPDQLESSINGTKYHVELINSTIKAKKESAEADKSQAQADLYKKKVENFGSEAPKNLDAFGKLEWEKDHGYFDNTEDGTFDKARYDAALEVVEKKNPSRGQGQPKSISYENKPTEAVWHDDAYWSLSGEKLDPTKIQPANGGLGVRGEQVMMRIQGAASESVQTLRNITELPISVSTGFLGGRQQGPSLLDANKEALANTMTSEEVKDYTTTIAGVQRNLSAIEATGLMPSGTLTHQMDAVVWKQGDTNFNKMRKLAEARQIVERGLQPFIKNPKIGEDEKDYMRSLVADLKEAVPFTVHDVNELERHGKHKQTIRDFATKEVSKSGARQSSEEAKFNPVKHGTMEYNTPEEVISDPSLSDADVTTILTQMGVPHGN